MEINSSSITTQAPLQVQQPQQVTERRAFEEDLAAQEEQAQQSVETTPAPTEDQDSTVDYGNLIREARTQQAQSVQAPAAANESDQAEDVQHAAVAAYQNNQDTYEAPTSSGELQPRVDAIV